MRVEIFGLVSESDNYIIDKITNKFYFSKESFLQLKEIVEIIQGKDMYMGYPEMLTLEFTGAVLKV